MKKFWILSLIIAVGVTAFSLYQPAEVAGKKADVADKKSDVADTKTVAAGKKSLAAGKETNKFRKSRNAVVGKYIVVLDENAPSIRYEEPNEKAHGLAAKYRGRVDKVYEAALKGFSVAMNEKQARALSEDSAVAYVEEDAEHFISGIQENVVWGIDRTDQRDLPLDGMFDFAETGQGVNTYVIDTGIRTSHVEFGGRAVMAYSAIKDGNATGDCHGHGTHVAGTLAGSTFGVAKNATIYGVRVMNCQGSGTTSDIVAGIDWVTKRHVKPAVANMSLGGGGSMTMDAAVRKSMAAGVTYVIAAGNGNQNSCFVSPARVTEALVVGATDNQDRRAYFSNFGECVDIFAPGVGITSAGNSDDYAIRGMSGTSMASPHVAGVAALYLEANPTASPAQVNQAIIQAATTGIVGDPMGTPNLLLYANFGEEPEVCRGREFSGIFTAPGQVEYFSSEYGFRGRTGVYTGTLTAPSGTSFRVELEKTSKGTGVWQSVLAGTSGQRVSTSQSASVFRWKVTSVSGAGQYFLCTEAP